MRGADVTPREIRLATGERRIRGRASTAPPSAAVQMAEPPHVNQKGARRSQGPKQRADKAGIRS
eukprot:14420449-Alexandrium_andersonii.AAC.1